MGSFFLGGQDGGPLLAMPQDAHGMLQARQDPKQLKPEVLKSEHATSPTLTHGFGSCLPGPSKYVTKSKRPVFDIHFGGPGRSFLLSRPVMGVMNAITGVLNFADCPTDSSIRVYLAHRVQIQSLPLVTKGYPSNKNLLAQIQNFLNAYLEGANTYCN